MIDIITKTVVNVRHHSGESGTTTTYDFDKFIGGGDKLTMQGYWPLPPGTRVKITIEVAAAEE